MKWYLIPILFIGFMIIRFIINYYKYHRIKTLHSDYWNYIKEKKIDFAEKSSEIVSLFKDAGLKDSGVMHQEFMGYGQFANMQASVFDNITNLRKDIVGIVDLKFTEAKGVYKKRYRDSFNPVFWIDFILKLPVYIMEFLGILPEKMAVKIFLLIYWIIAAIIGLEKINFWDYLLK